MRTPERRPTKMTKLTWSESIFGKDFPDRALALEARNEKFPKGRVEYDPLMGWIIIALGRPTFPEDWREHEGGLIRA